MKFNQSDLTITTPGPWKAAGGYIRDKAGDCLGTYPFSLGDMTDHNNGRLMAAAPELLAAVKAAASGLWEFVNTEDISPDHKRKLTDMQTDLLAAAKLVLPPDDFKGDL